MFHNDLAEILEGKEKLIELQKEGKYVFHGSSFILKDLEPRQALNYDNVQKKMVNDGEPAVAATSYVEIAIFRAIINNKLRVGGKYWSEFGVNNGVPYFRTHPWVLKAAEVAEGYVYVLKKEDFWEKSPMEWRCSSKVKPYKVFKVSFKDLPVNIELRD